MAPEKLIVKLDSQIMNSMDLCWERYRLEMVEHWRSRSKPPAMEKGSIMHAMVELYRNGKKAGMTDVENHGRLVEECVLAGRVSGSNTDRTLEEVEAVIVAFKEYVLRWQYDGWTILDVEQPFTKELYDSDDLQILVEGIVDARVIDPTEGQCVVDSKTEGRKSYPYILSNQFQTYEWAFNVPVIVDKIGFQTSLENKERFRRQVHRSGPAAIAEWRSDVIQKVREAIEWHKKLDAGLKFLPKNRTSCDKYSGCVYQRVCKEDPEIREFKLQAYFSKEKPWDPYTRDEVEAVEVED